MKDRGKKLLLINYEFPPLGGGAGTATRETAAALVRQGHEVAVLTGGFGDLPAEEDVLGARVVRVPSRRRQAGSSTPFEMISFVLAAMRRAPLLVKELQPAAAVCFFSIPSGIVGMRLLATMKLPYIVSLRGGDVPGFHPGAMAAWHRLTLPLTRRIWSRASAVTANSQNLADLAHLTMPELDVPVIPNGVDTNVFHPADEPSSAPEIRALFLGRLNTQKGLDHLLYAMAETEQAWPVGLSLIIAGSGPEEQRLKSISRALGLDAHVIFKGRVAPGDVPALYREADFFVLPSLDEGMPNVALEAMASALPVVATDIDGCTALVEHGRSGYIVPRGGDCAPEHEPLSRAVLDLALMDPGQRRNMGMNGRARAGSFSWDETARALAALLPG